MDDLVSQLSAREMAELSALADGTLPAERRSAVEARVAASPELRALVDRQRRAVIATRAMPSEPLPASLRTGVEARLGTLEAGRGRAWRVLPRLAFGGAVAVVAAIALAVALSGGPAGATVAEAAALAARPPSGPPPARLDASQARLAVAVDGVVFPDLLRAYGWRTVGVRRDRFAGRNATVVYYAKGDRRIGYVIVAGSGLPRPSGAHATVRGGVEYRTLRANGRPAVTWRRLGHTCVLTGTASNGELVTLASWQGGLR